MGEMISYVRYLLPDNVVNGLERECLRRSLSEEERGEHERDLERGSDGGLPTGMNRGFVEEAGRVMGAARDGFPVGRRQINRIQLVMKCLKSGNEHSNVLNFP